MTLWPVREVEPHNAPALNCPLAADHASSLEGAFRQDPSAASACYTAAQSALTEPEIADHQGITMDHLQRLPDNFCQLEPRAVPAAVRHVHAAGFAEFDDPVVQLASRHIVPRLHIAPAFGRPRLAWATQGRRKGDACVAPTVV